MDESTIYPIHALSRSADRRFGVGAGVSDKDGIAPTFETSLCQPLFSLLLHEANTNKCRSEASDIPFDE